MMNDELSKDEASGYRAHCGPAAPPSFIIHHFAFIIWE
jgi:hypothetical protein